MPHTPHEKKRVLARVRRIKGQLTALETALESDAQCTAVLQQIAAVRGAVGGLMMEVLEAHLPKVAPPLQRSQEAPLDANPLVGIPRLVGADGGGEPGPVAHVLYPVGAYPLPGQPL